jgi:hypothetical protein
LADRLYPFNSEHYDWLYDTTLLTIKRVGKARRRLTRK